LALAERGADVAISYQNSADAAEKVVQQIERLGRRAVAFQADSADPAAITQLVEDTATTLGGIEILVNNAGIASSGRFEDLGLTDVDALLAVNIKAAILICQAVIPRLEAGGRIILIGSSLADRIVSPDVTIYAITKSAQIALARGLARELGTRDVTVNLVQPGATDTEMDPSTSAHADELRTMTPLGRYGKPKDVAAAVTFFASPAARQITGATLTVDGGLNA
jgi:NAD(P)-dependent dehydrogenase (short-subunit alcohol dehydrogenase family)